MASRWLPAITRAFSGAAFAMGSGLKGALRPSVLWRSAAIALCAGSIALWLFARHWEVAQYFVIAFVPLLFASFGLTGAQADHARFSAPATTAGGFDLAGGAMDLAHGLAGLGHAALALALAVVCGWLLCGLLLTLLASCRWLLPEAVRRSLEKQPGLRAAEVAEARKGALWRLPLRIIGVLLLSQLIYLAAMFVPHLGLLWFPLLAYLPVAFLAERALRGLGSVAERDAALKRKRGAFVLFGLIVLAMSCVPVLNLLAPALLVIGTTRLVHRGLGGLRTDIAQAA